MPTTHPYSFGIEEEYFLVSRRTGNIKTEPPRGFMQQARRALGAQLKTEILQSQIEVASRPMLKADDATSALRSFRTVLSDIGQKHGVGIIAAGTHPLAMPQQQKMTRKRRYKKVIDDLGMVGLGNALCGLHVHVEVPEPDHRVQIMHRLVPFLPLLLALSTSSPFWAGCDTGLLGYRNAANDALPRTGFPEMFQSLKEYEDYITALVEPNIIPDSTYVWWALRPCLQHPTLELRLTDCCTSVDDAVAIASLYRALVRRLVCDRGLNREFSAITRALSEENRWRAQRYGTDGTYVDVASKEAKPFKTLLEETIALLADDIDALQLAPQIEHLRTLQKRGTAAHLQLALYRNLLKSGLRHRQALLEVAKWLRASTEVGDFVVEEAGCTSIARKVPEPRLKTEERTARFVA
jgi:glutamate---cysteine ligase / carboxylate-amine ligase